MNSLNPRYLDSIQYEGNDLMILRRLGEFKGKQELFVRQRPEILEHLKTIATIESAESSNRLEGVLATKKRLKSLVLRTTEPKNRSEQEIAGYRDALGLIHESAEYMPFSNNLIRQLHKTIYGYVGGDWKPTDNDIVERGPDGEITRVRFRTVSAVATPQAIDSMVERYAAAVSDQREPLVIIPLAILDFLCIHPFRDGNGRVVRLLTLLLLYHFDFSVGRYISLERVFESSRDGYYENLEASSQGWHDSEHDPFPWLRYFWGVVLKAYSEFEERVGTLDGAGSKTDRIIATIERKIGPVPISQLEDECPGVSRDMIRHVLRQLRDEGRVKVVGKGRGAKWVKTDEW